MKTIVALGFMVAAFIGAPVAAADINVFGFNIGNQDNAHANFGSIAVATRGSTANAISDDFAVAVAFNGGIATANGDRINIAIANGGEALSTGRGPNLAIANHGGARIQGGIWNLAVGQRGIASTVNSNFSVAVAGPDSTAAVNNSTLGVAFARGTRPGFPAGQGAGSQANVSSNLSVAVAFCGGTSISAQGDRINVSGRCRSN
jgi:hypothetical protein